MNDAPEVRSPKPEVGSTKLTPDSGLSTQVKKIKSTKNDVLF
jgi:hypothetical protein